MTYKLYREASVFKHGRNEDRKYKIIYIVNQTYLVHLHGLNSVVKKSEFAYPTGMFEHYFKKVN